MGITAVVITKNEQDNIARCLQSLAFCDEIIVLDSMSTDGTAEIARKFTSKVFVEPWRGYVEQKNRANDLSSNDWILSIDADEVVPVELAQEIKRAVTLPTKSAYSMARRTIHLGRWIRHGGWYPNRLVRLFRKSHGTWEGTELHEYWKSSGDVGVLNADLLHYSFKDIADQVDRNNRYSSLGAIELSRRGKRFTGLVLFSKSITKFFETYFLKRGYKDGYPGFIISVSAAYSVFLKWAKLWEIEKQKS